MIGEDPSIYVECLLHPLSDDATAEIYLRFLQTQWRSPERVVDVETNRFEAVGELRDGEANWVPWHEAVEQEIRISGLTVEELTTTGRVVELNVPGSTEAELIRDAENRVTGRLVRTRFPLSGRLTIGGTTEASTPRVVVVRVEVENTATLAGTDEESRAVRRDLAARQSFVGAHVLLTATDAMFVSLVDPPEWAAEVASRCDNARCWPFLAGERGETSG